jgi:hypothetical protein
LKVAAATAPAVCTPSGAALPIQFSFLLVHALRLLPCRSLSIDSFGFFEQDASIVSSATVAAAANIVVSTFAEASFSSLLSGFFRVCMFHR